jgi:hypothetical protein
MSDDPKPPPTTPELLARIEALTLEVGRLKTELSAAEGESAKALRAELAEVREELKALKASAPKTTPAAPKRGFFDLFD